MIFTKQKSGRNCHDLHSLCNDVILVHVHLHLRHPRPVVRPTFPIQGLLLPVPAQLLRDKYNFANKH